MARGFASLSPELRRLYSSYGGQAVHEYGTGRQWTHAEAIAAGVKGRASKRAKADREALKDMLRGREGETRGDV